MTSIFGILYDIHPSENNEDENNIFWYGLWILHISADISKSEILQNFSTVTVAAENRYSGDYSWSYYLEKLNLWKVPIWRLISAPSILKTEIWKQVVGGSPGL